MLQFIVLCGKSCSWLKGHLLNAPSSLVTFSLNLIKAGLSGLHTDRIMDRSAELVPCQGGSCICSSMGPRWGSGTAAWGMWSLGRLQQQAAHRPQQKHIQSLPLHKATGSPFPLLSNAVWYDIFFFHHHHRNLFLLPLCCSG